MFNSIKITVYYSVCMRTSDDKVRISDEAVRVQSVSFPHISDVPESFLSNQSHLKFCRVEL